MAFRITRDCVACGACIHKCTLKAIFVNQDDEYAINPAQCTECIDIGRRRCYNVCQVDAIQPDPDHVENKTTLWEKHRLLRTMPSD